MGNFKLKITHQQKKVMFEFLKSKPELVCGKFTKRFTWKEAEEQWKQLTLLLNSTQGPKKDWKSWRKTWHDLRCRSKWKAKKRENTQNDFNGNSSTQEEDEILQLISPEALLQNEEEISFDFVEVIHNQDDDEDVDIQLNEPSTSIQGISTLIEGKTLIDESLSMNPDEIPNFEEGKKIPIYKSEKRSFHKFKNCKEGLACYEKYLCGKLALKQKYQEEKIKIKMKKVENEERKITIMEKIASAIEKIM